MTQAPQQAKIQPRSDDYATAYAKNITHLRGVLLQQDWLSEVQTKRLSDGQVMAFVRVSSSYPARKRRQVFQTLVELLDN